MPNRTDWPDLTSFAVCNRVPHGLFCDLGDIWVRLSGSIAIHRNTLRDWLITSSGINPGYMMDVWPIMMCRLSRRIDAIYMTEMVDTSRYTSRQVGDFIGFGKPVEQRVVSFPRESRHGEFPLRVASNVRRCHGLAV